MISTGENECQKVKRTCLYVHENSKAININFDKLRLFVKNKISMFDSFPTWGGSHVDPNKYSLEEIIGFVCTVDALNFCFWPFNDMKNNSEIFNEFEYGNLVENAAKILNLKEDFFKAEKLMILTEEELTEKVFRNGFPLMTERTRSLNELGKFIVEKYDGKFENWINVCGLNCLNLVSSIISGVSTFRDETIYSGKQIFLYKRAQILVADLYHALKELNNPINLEHVSELTMFADYRVPQILIELGIFEYDTKLAEIIDNKQQILPNSFYEIEIRANTVIAVECIKRELKDVYNKDVISVQIDYLLWNEGEILRNDIKTHHRTLTVFY